MNETSRETLELFIEKAEILKNWALSMNNFGGLMGIIRYSDDEEWRFHPELQGFLLTFRMFIQRGDGIALYLQNSRGQLERPGLLDLPGMSNGWYVKVRQAYKWVADFLAIAPSNLIYDGKPITRWEVLETFLYGYFAHNNQRESYDQWRLDRGLFGELRFEFVTILQFMFGQILEIAEVSKQELDLPAPQVDAS